MAKPQKIDILATGVRNVKNVNRYIIGSGASTEVKKIINDRGTPGARNLFFIDKFFEKNTPLINGFNFQAEDHIRYINSSDEPTTSGINRIMEDLRQYDDANFSTVVGIGGGTTMDTAKAVSNLLTNGGEAEDYQGWDLVKRPGVYKIAVPTISGTGAEATRTCVMTNTASGLKLGMNSDHTVFDFIVMDPDLTATVPRDQYFWTGMDAYIHCIESLAGRYRNAIGDAYSRQTIELCRQVFGGVMDMQSSENRERLMVASYLGGCAIATSYVGLIHPLSAGLSVVLGVHHCVANCIVMRAMKGFYPEEFDEFWDFVHRHNVEIPKGVCEGLSDAELEGLYRATIIHEKPLTNALGDNFASVLTKDKIIELFLAM